LSRPVEAERFTGIACVLRRDDQGARAHFETLASWPDPIESSAGILILASFLADRGQLDEAASVLRRGVETDRVTGQTSLAATKLTRLAYLQEKGVRRSAARADALNAVALDPSPEVLRNAATALARCGFPADAERVLGMLNPALQGPWFDVIRLQVRGEIQLAQRQYGAAITSLESASRREAASHAREYLCRGLVVQGDFIRASQTCAEILSRPGLVWGSPELHPPGTLYFTEQLLKGRRR
jgi:predicted negative regulator of RcsB-dependent stress response